MDLIEDKACWGARDLNDSGFKLALGDLMAVCKRSSDEVWIKHSHGIEQDCDQAPWSRHVAGKLPAQIQISPRFPSKAVVVRPEQNFFLEPGCTARIFVRVPIWVRFGLDKGDASALLELPTAILSLTWFGNFDRGEICYWVSSSARREAASLSERPHLALCPIQIQNDSTEELQISKLKLQVETLSLFFDGAQLWGNETTVSYRGTDSVSKVEIRRGAPKEAVQAKKLCGPRRNIRRSMNLLTFERVWRLAAGYDG